MTFDDAFIRLIDPQHEGGYVDNPKDPGGETNMGVTWPTLRRAISLGLVPVGTTIKALSVSQAKTIYLSFYWQAAGCEMVPDVVRYDLFDAAVNSGVVQAIKFLQAAAGYTVDGKISPQMSKYIQPMAPYRLLLRFEAERLDFLNNLATWPTFGKGWVQRIATNMKAA